MEKLFTEEKLIRDLHMCRDGNTLTYNLGDEMFARKGAARAESFGKGDTLRMLDNSSFVFVSDKVAYTAGIDGGKSPIKAKGDIVKNLAKAKVTGPAPNKNGTKIACAIGGITKPDTWGERSYCGIIDLEASVFELFDIEIFGGSALFFPQGDIVLFCVLDLKGGQLYIFKDDEILGQFIGSAPAISPDGSMVAYRKEGSITIAKAGADQWELSDRKSQPDQGMGPNYNAPVWINSKTVVYDSGTELYRFDIEKNNAKKIVDLPGLAVTRSQSLAGPFQGGVVAVAKEENGYSALLIKVED